MTKSSNALGTEGSASEFGERPRPVRALAFVVFLGLLGVVGTWLACLRTPACSVDRAGLAGRGHWRWEGRQPLGPGGTALTGGLELPRPGFGDSVPLQWSGFEIPTGDAGEVLLAGIRWTWSREHEAYDVTLTVEALEGGRPSLEGEDAETVRLAPGRHRLLLVAAHDEESGLRVRALLGETANPVEVRGGEDLPVVAADGSPEPTPPFSVIVHLDGGRNAARVKDLRVLAAARLEFDRDYPRNLRFAPPPGPAGASSSQGLVLSGPMAEGSR